MTTQQLIDEIKVQLDSDILDYGWLRQIVRDNSRIRDPDTITTLVSNAVTELYQSGLVVIGEARNVSGVVRVIQWNGTREDVLAKLRVLIADGGNFPTIDQLNGFWIEKVG